MEHANVDQDITISIPLLQQKGIRRSNQVRFCSIISQHIKLLQWRVRSKQAALTFVSFVFVIKQISTFPNLEKDEMISDYVKTKLPATYSCRGRPM